MTINMLRSAYMFALEKENTALKQKQDLARLLMQAVNVYIDIDSKPLDLITALNNYADARRRWQYWKAQREHLFTELKGIGED